MNYILYLAMIDQINVCIKWLALADTCLTITTDHVEKVAMAHSLALASTSSLRVPVLWAMIARRGPVVSISSAFFIIILDSVIAQLLVNCTAGNRWYSLAKAATGELSWAKNREAKEKERGDDPFPSLGKTFVLYLSDEHYLYR